MNFVGPSSFLYVTGDLDRIRIGNDIMPIRSASDGTLRGMDIAFLIEAAEERLRFTGNSGYSQQYSFSRKILAQQPTDANSRIMQAFGSSMGEWLDDGEIPDILQIQSYSLAHLTDYVPGLNAVSISSVETSASGESITRQPIEELFSNVAALNRRETSNPYVDYSATVGMSSIVDLPAYPTSRQEFSEWVAYVESHVYSAFFESIGRKYTVTPGEQTLTEYGIANISVDFSNVSFASNCPDVSFSRKRDIYGIISVSSFRSPSETKDYYLAKLSANGVVTNASVQSVCQTIRSLYPNNLEIQESDMSGSVDTATNTVELKKIFCVDELRDRTRWD